MDGFCEWMMGFRKCQDFHKILLQFSEVILHDLRSAGAHTIVTCPWFDSPVEKPRQLRISQL